MKNHSAIAKRNEIWLKNYGKLSKLQEKHGHCCPELLKNISGSMKQLRKWIRFQRVMKQAKKLSPWKRQLLNKLNATWSNKPKTIRQENSARDKKIQHAAQLNLRDLRWQAQLNFLQFFIENNKQAYPSSSSDNLQEKQLAKWCNTQRQLKKLGKISTQRVDILESIKFIWHPRKNTWITNFNKLKRFLILHKHRSPSASSKRASEKKLGVWCKYQELIKDKLTKQQLQRLNDVGFSKIQKNN